MVLTRSGNLGINDTSPSDRLSVGGDASITGDLSVVGSGKSITTQKIVKVGGSSTEFLKADGSVDNSTYMLVGTALTTVQQDTTPNLGGNLVLNGNDILGTGNIDIIGEIHGNKAHITGVTTSQNGFTSGIGTGGAVQINVVGSTLTFNVVGVGSTSLTLL